MFFFITKRHHDLIMLNHNKYGSLLWKKFKEAIKDRSVSPFSGNDLLDCQSVTKNVNEKLPF